MALNKVAKKWVAALRSGKYAQTQKRLAEKQSQNKKALPERCCLGVLCDLAVEAGVIKSYVKDSWYLPEQVMLWAGLQWRNGTYAATEGTTNLAIQNDDGKSFKQIARIIEREPDGLFR